MRLPMSAAVLALTCIPLAAHAEIITVTIEGSLQDVSDPNNFFEGATRWWSSITIDTDTTQVFDSDTRRQYSGIASYSIGPNAGGSFDGLLSVVDNSPNNPSGATFDLLAIEGNNLNIFGGGFFALDLGGFLFDTTDLPPLGLTFADGFTPGVVGSEYRNFAANAFADLVADTVTVTPAPGTACVLLAAPALLRRRRSAR